MNQRGKLLVVGAGQSADLITVRGLNALSALTEQDVVLFDRLIDERLLTYTKARTVNVGKLPYCHSVRQHQINELIRTHLAENVTVCRLKGGDSVLFARLTEEVNTAVDAGAAVEVIPGVTTMSATSARIAAGLTNRDDASGLITLTGHKRADRIGDEYDWNAIAKLNMTIVVYMTVKNLPAIANNLVDAGMDGATPVLVGEKVETEEERLFFTTLSDLPDAIERHDITFPAIAIIGSVVATAPESAMNLLDVEKTR